MTPEEEFRDLRQENKMLREIIQQQQELIEQVQMRWEKGAKKCYLAVRLSPTSTTDKARSNLTNWLLALFYIFPLYKREYKFNRVFGNRK